MTPSSSRVATQYPMSRLRIGDHLVGKALLTREDVQHALQEQQRTGGRLGEILIGEGKLTAYRFHRELADQLGLPFVDVERDPSDERLLQVFERDTYLRLQAIPWRMDNGAVVIAATDPDQQALHIWAHSKYGGNYKLAVTSPYDVFWTVQRFFAQADDQDARELLWQQQPQLSARQLLATRSSRLLVAVLALAVLGAAFHPAGIMWALVALNVFFAATLTSKILFHVLGYKLDRAKRKDAWWLETQADMLDDLQLPIYTLLIPCYKEKAQTIAHIMDAVRKLDYPKAKLDVKFVVEADDNGTINNIKRLSPESYFEIIRVPFSLPRTKPKACNYALKFAKGQYVTIYDAEDRPEPYQLRKALLGFANADPEVICVQAKLNYYNRKENFLTRMFAIEYASWFHFMLPGLEKLRLPIPLGGTSNHFRTADLRNLMAWDPFNVTEDADLGVRLARRGYRTTVIDSITWEEAPIEMMQWMKQRARWIKGYMQTYMVHMRQPVKLVKQLGFRGTLGFAFFVGAPPLVFITMPLSLGLTVVSFAQHIVLPHWLYVLAAVNLVAGLASHWMIAVLAAMRDNWRDLLPHTVLFPLYWVLHCGASVRACWQLFTKPHHWDKTEHGISRYVVHTATRVNAALGQKTA